MTDAPSSAKRDSKVPMVIAVDGPAASGKGTIARALAWYFGLPHMDTGILYRSVALSMFRFGGDPGNEFEAVRACEGVAQFLERPGRQFLDEELDEQVVLGRHRFRPPSS